jgi:hypothetical protein
MFFGISKSAVFCLESVPMKCFWLLMVACLRLAPLAALLPVNAASAASGPAGVFNVLDHGVKGDVTLRNAASWTVHLVRLRRSGR